MISKEIELKIQTHFENFLDNKITAIMDLSLSDIEINPFLIAAIHRQLDIKTHRDLAKWIIMQRLERSLVTGFGSTLQSIAKEFSNEKSLPNLTARIKRNTKIYNLVIKSGSNHNVQVVKNIQQVLLNTKTIEPDSVPVFGICYGNEKTVSSIVRKYIDGVQLLIGKHFWNFISEDPNCYKKITEIATRVDKNYKDPNAGTLNEAIEYKINNLDSELKKKYGDTNKKFWDAILEESC